MGILEAKLVSEPRGLFVVLAGDGLAELGPEAEPLDRSRALTGSLAHVPGGPVNPLDHGQQPAAEDPVILGQPSRPPPEIPCT